MSEPPPAPRPRPSPAGPPPITIPPALASRESILRQAQQAAQAHLRQDSTDSEKKASSDWRDFFDEKVQVHVASRRCTFNVYTAGPSKAPAEGTKRPVLFCVHGGGYTGLSYALISEGLKDECAPELVL